MSGWVKTLDKSSGKHYFYNKVTRETSWEEPPGYSEAAGGGAAPAAAPAAGALSASASMQSLASDSSAPGVASSAAPAHGPAASAAAPAAAAAAPAAAGGDASKDDKPVWKQALDKSSGRVYYYNRVTKETSWEQPNEPFIPLKSEVNFSPNPMAESLAVQRASVISTNKAAPPPTSNPPPSAAAAPQPAAAAASVDADWREATDPRTGRKYFYNKKLNKTVWNDPRKPQAAAAPAAAAAPSAPPAAAAAAAAASSRAGENRDDSDTDGDGGLDAASDDEDDTGARRASEGEKPNVKALFNEAEEEEKAARDAAKAREHGLSVEQAEKMNALKKTTSALSAKGLEEEDDGDPDDEEFAFLFAKHRKGFFHRLMRSGHVLDRQEIMTYKKSLIKKALLKQNRHLDKDAVQTFKNIMSYMGDRESSRDSTRHATKLLRNVMSSPAGLRDEVFLQVCKQTTGNPKEASTLRGWELMTFFLASFPPSKPLRKFLLAYFEENKAHKEKQHSDAALQQIARFAENSIEWLPRIMSLGARKAVPSATELEALKTLRGMSIRVYFLDNTFKTFMVDSFTLVSDVLDMVVKKLAISNASIFGLYEFAETERMLNPKERVLDVYARWEEEEKERAQKEEKEQWRFVYKAKLILKPGHPEVKNDMEAINLLYMQSVMDVVSGKYPVKESHLVILAALQLQATFGDYHPEMHGHGWLIDKLEQFIPKALVALKDSKREAVVRAEFEQKIIAKYEKVKGFSAQEARLNYLDFVQQWPAYGVTHFNCQQRQFKDYPSPLLLGITCEGALLVHPETRAVLDEYKYTDIVTWGHSDDKLILVVGNVVQQRKIVFKTEEGAVINQLIHDYVKFKLAEKNSHAVAVMKKA